MIAPANIDGAACAAAADKFWLPAVTASTSSISTDKVIVPVVFATALAALYVLMNDFNEDSED